MPLLRSGNDPLLSVATGLAVTAALAVTLGLTLALGLTLLLGLLLGTTTTTTAGTDHGSG